MVSKIKSFIASKDFKKIVIYFLITRLLLALVGIKSRMDYPILQRMYDAGREEINVYGSVGTVLHGWDSGWYLDIAKHGYTELISNLNQGKSPYVFFPLYPITMKLVGFLFIGEVAGGILVSNICLFLSGIVLFLLVKTKYRSSDLALKSVKYLFIFPISFVFSAIQSESLFLLLLLLVFLFIEEKKYLYSGIAGFFLALTRPLGFLVFIPIAYVIGMNSAKNKHLINAVSVLLPIIGLISYVLFVSLFTHNFGTIYFAESGWQKSFNLNPFSFFNLIWAWRNYHLTNINVIISIFMAIAAIFGATELGFGYLFIVASYLIAYISTSSLFWHIFSLPRYFVVLFPAYFLLAKLGKLSKTFDLSASLICVFFQMAFFYYWTTGTPIAM